MRPPFPPNKKQKDMEGECPGLPVPKALHCVMLSADGDSQKPFCVRPAPYGLPPEQAM